jgi:hypothetical protein
MSFFYVERDKYWNPPRPKHAQPWYQRALCYVLGHDLVQSEKRATGKVVFNPAFLPEYEVECLYTCNRCLKQKWRDGFHAKRFLKVNREEEFPVDNEGWPIGGDGQRLPLAKNYNCTGW